MRPQVSAASPKCGKEKKNKIAIKCTPLYRISPLFPAQDQGLKHFGAAVSLYYGQNMTGFSSIQMVYTGVDYYSTESVLPSDSKANRDNAQKTNEVLMKRLKDKK